LSDKLEAIVQKAYVELDKFYKIYGNDDKNPDKKILLAPAKVKVKLSKRTKIITPTPEPETIGTETMEPELGIETTEPVLEIVEPKEASVNLVSFDGLASKDIIAKVLELTGEKITICVKSKKNVLRHAGIILAKHGYTMKG
jgi:uncharacterized protein YpmB